MQITNFVTDVTGTSAVAFWSTFLPEYEWGYMVILDYRECNSCCL